MADRTNFSLSVPGFVGDQGSINRLEGGRRIAWRLVPDSYKNAITGKKEILASKVMVQVIAGTGVNADEVGLLVPRANRPSTEEASVVLETSATEGGPGDLIGYGCIVGAVFLEGLMDDATGTPRALPAAYKTELKANGTGAVFQKYTDGRAAFAN